MARLTKRVLSRLTLLGAVSGWIGLLALPSAGRAQSCDPSSVEFQEFNQFIVDAIEAEGFQYDRGCEPPVDPNDPVEMGAYQSCLGSPQNRNWPGGLFSTTDLEALSAHRDVHVDNRLSHIVPSNATPFLSPAGLGVVVHTQHPGGVAISPTTHVAGSDVVFTRMCTPPSGDRFSITPYLDVEVTAVGPVGEEGQRLGASLGDALNDLSIKTESGAAFDAASLVAMVADDDSAEDVLDGVHAGVTGYYNHQNFLNITNLSAAEIQGLADAVRDSVNIYPMAESALSFALNPQVLPRSELSVLMRSVDLPSASIYYDARQSWYVFRSDRAQSLSDPDPVVGLDWDEKPRNIPEPLNTTINVQRLQQAVSGVIDFYENQVPMPMHLVEVSSGDSTGADASPPVFSDEHGRSCITAAQADPSLGLQNSVCAMDEPDSHYYWPSAQARTSTADDLYVVVGINPTKTCCDPPSNASPIGGIALHHVQEPGTGHPYRKIWIGPINGTLSLAAWPHDNQLMLGAGFEDMIVVQIAPPSHPNLTNATASLTPSLADLSVPWVSFGHTGPNLNTTTRPRAADVLPWVELRFPEPGAAPMQAAALLVLAALWRRRRTRAS